MQVKGMVYEDKSGKLWLVQKKSLPKKKGDYNFWVADEILEVVFDPEGPSLKGDSKKEVTDGIKKLSK
jgi:hypothetical protein